MQRREFLIRSVSAAGAAWFFPKSILSAIGDQTLPKKFSASDTVTLGSTGIKTSRLAMGTGTVGVGRHSHQTDLGIKGLSELLLNGYDHGLRFFDSADSYAILMSPKPSSTCRAIKSRCLPSPGRAIPTPCVPISTASAANSVPTISIPA